MTELHQFVHSYVEHDATSSHTRNLQSLLREMGLVSEIFAVESRGAHCVSHDYREFLQYASGASRVLYQFAAASPICEFLQCIPQPLALSYHNITPFAFLQPWEPLIAPELQLARAQLNTLVTKTSYAIAMSRYSETELHDVGYAHTDVAPVLFDPTDFSRDIDRILDEKLGNARADATTAGARVLYVGRIAPHKCQHHILQSFFLYKRYYDADAQLYLVGGIASHLYWTVLHRLVDALGLSGSVHLTGGVSNAQLGAYYKHADVFLSLSAHEGFGVPILEAMAHDVPVVAFDAAAVGETLGDAGVLLPEKSAAYVAAAVDRVARDDDLRKALVARGNERVASYSLEAARTRWRTLLTTWLEEVA